MRIRGQLSVLFLVVALLPALVSAADIVRIVYVDDSAPGANNGTSWFNAYHFLQDALTVAQETNVFRHILSNTTAQCIDILQRQIHY